MPFKCDVHGWMNAYAGVLDHPYFAVSKPDGSFSIPNLPPGSYTLARVAREARHADAAGHGRREGIEGGRELHVQGRRGSELVTHGSGFRVPVPGSGSGFTGSQNLEPEPGTRTWNLELGTRNQPPCGFTATRRFVSAATVLLIVAGGLVTSTGSGLAVPDWPTSYGWNMFTFPMKHMVGGIFYEHGHRLIASGVGFLTIILALWIWKAEPRRWMRVLGFTALAAVCVQGLLGGITVLYFLPTPVSTAHAGLAQIFFCLTIAIALFTSRGWTGPKHEPVDDRMLRLVATTTTAFIYLQILVGATMRHSDAGLAIPDFPLVFGGIVPPEWTPQIAIHLRASRRRADRDAGHRGDGRPRLVSPLAALRASPARDDARVPRARSGDAWRLRHLV